MSTSSLPLLPRGLHTHAPGLLLAILVLAALASVFLLRPTEGARTALPDGVPLLARELTFLDGANGVVQVRSPAHPELSRTLPAETHHFIRGVLRGLARERRQHHQLREAPFRLAAWPDGRLTLEDTTTMRVIALESFGPTNAAEFRRLLTPERSTVPGEPNRFKEVP